MSLDDALALAGQVLADYEVAGLDGVSGGERIWAGRLAQALRDLIAAAVSRSASPDASGAGDPSADPSAVELLAASRVLQAGLARTAGQTARLEAVGATLATRPARSGGGRAGLRRLVMAWVRRAAGQGPQRPGLEAGSVWLSAGEAATAGQALADAVAWQAQYGDCVGSGTGLGSHEVMIAAYVALRCRLEAGRR